MGHLEFKPKLAVTALDDDRDYQAFLSEAESGISFVPEVYQSTGAPSLAHDFGDFAKWVREKDPSIPVSIPANIPKLLRRNADVWLPLVYLASDTSVQVFLNMAANYLYDKAKGALKGDKPRIQLRVVYQDKTAGKTKRLEFSGDAEALGKAIGRFDVNNFFDDAS